MSWILIRLCFIVIIIRFAWHCAAKCAKLMVNNATTNYVRVDATATAAAHIFPGGDEPWRAVWCGHIKLIVEPRSARRYGGHQKSQRRSHWLPVDIVRSIKGRPNSIRKYFERKNNVRLTSNFLTIFRIDIRMPKSTESATTYYTRIHKIN